jgi:hypothetical protein
MAVWFARPAIVFAAAGFQLAAAYASYLASSNRLTDTHDPKWLTTALHEFADPGFKTIRAQSNPRRTSWHAVAA